VNVEGHFVFTFTKENNDGVIKSGYSVCFFFYRQRKFFSTIDYSFWVIRRKMVKNIKIIKK
jgi:hypothetical protein